MGFFSNTRFPWEEFLVIGSENVAVLLPTRGPSVQLLTYDFSPPITRRGMVLAMVIPITYRPHTFPGFSMPLGSNACLMERMRRMVALDSVLSKYACFA